MNFSLNCLAWNGHNLAQPGSAGGMNVHKLTLLYCISETVILFIAVSNVLCLAIT